MSAAHSRLLRMSKLEPFQNALFSEPAVADEPLRR